MLHFAVATKGVLKAAEAANAGLDWVLDKKITLTFINAGRRDAIVAVCAIPLIGPNDVISTSFGWQLVRAGATVAGPVSIQRFGTDLAFYSYMEGGAETSGNCGFHVMEGTDGDFVLMGALSSNPRVLMGHGSLRRVSGDTARVTDSFTYRFR